MVLIAVVDMTIVSEVPFIVVYAEHTETGFVGVSFLSLLIISITVFFLEEKKTIVCHCKCQQFIISGILQQCCPNCL